MSQSKIYAPIRRRFVLVFDVETTGLLPKNKVGQEIPIESYPYIIQLSFVLYDLYQHNAVITFDSYVKIPDNIEIPDEVIKLTGITKTLCQEKGKDILEILTHFYDAYMKSETITAHNIDFDEKMILIELQRNHIDVLGNIPYCFTLFNRIYERLRGVERFCTMKKGIYICAVKTETRTFRKWPKLSELYKKLFNEIPDGLHNSMVDVDACLRCYLRMRHGL
jgi:DNA polymerase III epsilon subunit-like protein